MAYRRTSRRRNFGKRRRRSSRMRYIKRRTGAKSQSRQIASLERRVNTLTKEASQYAQFEVRPNESGGSTGIDLTDGQFHSSYLVKPQQWVPLFQTAALTGQTDTNTVNKMKITSADLQFVFSPTDSLLPCTPRIVRVWVMKLRRETSRDVLAETSNMTSAGLNALNNNDLIHKSSVGGGLFTMVKWNPAAFDIKMYREFTIANILEETGSVDGDTSLTNTKDALKRCRMRFSMGNELKVPKGAVLEMNNQDVQDSDRWFVVVHVGGFDGGTSAVNGIRMDTNWCLNTRMYI